MNSILFYILLTPLILLGVSQALIALGKVTQNHFLSFYGRFIASFLALAVCALYGTIASACLNVVGYGGLGQWTTARAFKYTMWYSTGVWFDIEDPNNYLGTTRPAVFLGNHQTELDVLYLGHVFPRYTSVTAKKSLKYTPFLGWFSMFRSSVIQAILVFGSYIMLLTYVFARSGYEQKRLHRTILPHPSCGRLRCRSKANARSQTKRLYLPRRNTLLL